eukprot:12411062-Karenia_brevis.AAC.1
MHACRQTNRQTNRQIDRQAGRQAGRQASSSQAGRQGGLNTFGSDNQQILAKFGLQAGLVGIAKLLGLPTYGSKADVAERIAAAVTKPQEKRCRSRSRSRSLSTQATS